MRAAQDARALLKGIPGLVPAVKGARRARARARWQSQELRFHLSRTRRGRRIDAYLRSHPDRRLHLGTGSNVYDGWLNTDVVDFLRTNQVVYLDARTTFPLPDASFDLVFSEHMIEHLTHAEGAFCLRECHRVLRPGGRVRVATPSLDRLVRLYGRELSDLERRYLRWSIDTWVERAHGYLAGYVLNNIMRNFGHRFVYDRATLGAALEAAGFVDVEEMPVGESPDPRLRALERHMRSVAELNAFETLVLEARRP